MHWAACASALGHLEIHHRGVPDAGDVREKMPRASARQRGNAGQAVVARQCKQRHMFTRLLWRLYEHATQAIVAQRDLIENSLREPK